MGKYIQTGKAKGKVLDLEREHGAKTVPAKDVKHYFDQGYAIICVVDNSIFEAAAYCFDEDEIRDFMDQNDPRPKTWMTMDKTKAEELVK